VWGLGWSSTIGLIEADLLHSKFESVGVGGLGIGTGGDLGLTWDWDWGLGIGIGMEDTRFVSPISQTYRISQRERKGRENL
jgi:hypothetical protein